jgi:hypothetical protein
MATGHRYIDAPDIEVCKPSGPQSRITLADPHQRGGCSNERMRHAQPETELLRRVQGSDQAGYRLLIIDCVKIDVVQFRKSVGNFAGLMQH